MNYQKLDKIVNTIKALFTIAQFVFLWVSIYHIANGKEVLEVIKWFVVLYLIVNSSTYESIKKDINNSLN